MSKRDYKVATTDGIELEPLGGPKMDKDNDGKKNGVKYGECFKRSLIIFCVSGKIHFVFFSFGWKENIEYINNFNVTAQHNEMM